MKGDGELIKNQPSDYSFWQLMFAVWTVVFLLGIACNAHNISLDREIKNTNDGFNLGRITGYNKTCKIESKLFIQDSVSNREPNMLFDKHFTRGFKYGSEECLKKQIREKKQIDKPIFSTFPRPMYSAGDLINFCNGKPGSERMAICDYYILGVYDGQARVAIEWAKANRINFYYPQYMVKTNEILNFAKEDLPYDHTYLRARALEQPIKMEVSIIDENWEGYYSETTAVERLLWIFTFKYERGYTTENLEKRRCLTATWSGLGNTGCFWYAVFRDSPHFLPSDADTKKFVRKDELLLSDLKLLCEGGKLDRLKCESYIFAVYKTADIQTAARLPKEVEPERYKNGLNYTYGWWQYAKWEYRGRSVVMNAFETYIKETPGLLNKSAHGVIFDAFIEKFPKKPRSG